MAMMALLRLKSKPSKGAETAVFCRNNPPADGSFSVLHAIPAPFFAGVKRRQQMEANAHRRSTKSGTSKPAETATPLR